jgi:quinol monooxygenase YgiN
MPVTERGHRRAFLKHVGGAAAGAVLGVGAVPAAAKGDEITAVTWIRGIEGKEEELKEHLLSLAAPTRAEAGCIAYDLYQSPDQKNHFVRLEVWTSLDALEAHKKTPHIRSSFARRQREGWTTEITIWKRVPG